MRGRGLRRVLAVCLLLFVFSFPARAEEASPEEYYARQWQDSGAADLWETLPEDTRQLLGRLNISQEDVRGFSAVTPDALSRQLWGLIGGLLEKPLKVMAGVVAVVLLCALSESAGTVTRLSTCSATFGALSTLSVCGCLLAPLTGCFSSVSRAVESTVVFMQSFVPVYTGVLVAGGHAASAVSFQSIVLYVCALFQLLIQTAVMPLITVSLALGIAGAVTPEWRLGEWGKAVNRIVTAGLSLLMTVFIGVLSLQHLTGAAADSLGGKMVKFSLSSFVPIVGSALSEAFSAISGSVQLMRSALGCFSIVAVAVIILPPLIRVLLWSILLQIGSALAGMVQLSSANALFSAARNVMKTLLAVLLSGGMFMILATAIVTGGVT